MGRTSDANERLMDAALDLIWEESYGAVTIDDICKRAEVKKGSFYYFFASKAELATAALERMWTLQWKPTMDARFSSSIDPVERLTGYLDGIYQRHAEIFKKTGKVLHEMTLPSSTTGVPMTYMIGDRQYIVVATGARGIPAELIALAVPL